MKLRNLLTHRIDGLAQGLLEWTDIVLFRKSLAPARAERPAALSEYSIWDPEIPAVYRWQRRRLSEERLRARLRHGLRFYVLREGPRVLASTWLAPGPERFIDEIATGIAVPRGGLWIRDIYVPPSERGRRRFSAILDAALSCYPGATALYSDVKATNGSSLSAHACYGLQPIGRLRALRVLRRVVVRPAVRPGLDVRRMWEPNRRLIWTGHDYQRFVHEHMA